MHRLLSIVAAIAALAVTAMPASAQSRIRVGTLDCRGQTTSFILGSTTDLRCVFHPSAGPRQAYHGIVRKFGVDIGINQEVAVGWIVLAPTRQIGLGDLAGSYGGVSGSASVGVGAGANVLVGGSHNSFALQPVSLQGQTGLSVAAGIADLELRFGR